MSTTNNDDLHDGDQAQDVDSVELPASQPSAMQNIMALRNNPSAKRGLILLGTGILAVVIIVIVFVARMNRPAQPKLPADITGVSVGGAPGAMQDDKSGAGNNQQFNDMVTGVAKERVDQAQKDGTSVQPMSVTVERDLRNAPPVQAPAPQQSYVAPAYQTTQNPVQDPAYQNMMANARQALTSLTRSRELGTAVFDGSPKLPAEKTAQGQPTGAAGTGVAAASTSASQTVTMIEAGAVVSARVETAINSDVGGEFVATIVTGKYAGARLLGTAARAGVLVKPVFTLMSIPGSGLTLPISAAGLDAQTLENGTATDVDRKLFVKYGVQPLAAALSALGDAFGKSGGNTVINGNTTVTTTPDVEGKRALGIGVGAAAGTFTKDVGKLDTEPTVRVATGTIMGVLFTKDVIYTPKTQ